MMRTEKVETIASLEKMLREAKSVYLADFQGMTVEVLSELRKRCRKSDVQIRVVKNTLLRRAADSTGIAELAPSLKGPTALVTSRVDEVAPAKVLVDFAKDFKAPALKMGVVGGRTLNAAEVKAISALPSKDVLLGLLMGVLQTPLQNLASAVTAPLRDLAGVLNALAEKKGSAA
jgi:large subunit ribosomal protein L10